MAKTPYLPYPQIPQSKPTIPTNQKRSPRIKTYHTHHTDTKKTISNPKISVKKKKKEAKTRNFFLNSENLLYPSLPPNAILYISFLQFVLKRKSNSFTPQTLSSPSSLTLPWCRSGSSETLRVFKSLFLISYRVYFSTHQWSNIKL